jgi:deaminated glutathione amidase
VSFAAGLIQMRAGRDMARNFGDAAEMVSAAHGRGARFVSTPEMTNIIEPDRPRLKALVREEAADATVQGFSELARDLGLWLNAGSLALRGPAGKVVNRSLLFAPDGTIAARYDKIHLFDVDLPTGERLRESEAISPGNRACLAETALGRFGLTVCYDLRFPALFRALALRGASLFTVPSAFTVPTGEAHWQVLLRARAIETGSFVLAAAQGGVHDSGRATYGHSLAVSPWGEIIAEAGTEPAVLVFEVDLAAAEAARRRIPALKHGRAFGLKAPGGVANFRS